MHGGVKYWAESYKYMRYHIQGSVSMMMKLKFEVKDSPGINSWGGIAAKQKAKDILVGSGQPTQHTSNLVQPVVIALLFLRPSC